MTMVLLNSGRLFDGTNGDCPTGIQVLVAGKGIREVSDRPIRSAGARVIDVAGRMLMLGLIDAHVHAYASDVNVQKISAAGKDPLSDIELLAAGDQNLRLIMRAVELIRNDLT